MNRLAFGMAKWPGNLPLTLIKDVCRSSKPQCPKMCSSAKHAKTPVRCPEKNNRIFFKDEKSVIDQFHDLSVTNCNQHILSAVLLSTYLKWKSFQDMKCLLKNQLKIIREKNRQTIFSRRCSSNSPPDRNTIFSFFEKKGSPRKPFPRLTDFNYDSLGSNPLVLMKVLWQVMTNVRPNIDNSFDLRKFNDGAVQAFLSITNKIARHDTEGLRGLVTDDALAIISQNLEKLSSDHCEDLKVLDSEIKFHGPDSIEIIPRSDNHKILQVTVVYSYQKVPEMESRGFGIDPKVLEKISHVISHFRFVREYRNGEGGEWYCSHLNYYYIEHLVSNRLQRFVR